jgi:hypothetical protein
MGDGAGHHRRPSSDVALALDGARTEPTGAEPTEGESERTEAFVVRIALTARGRPLRSTVTHVRSLAEHASPGWETGEVVQFMEACLWMASRLPPSVLHGPQVVDQDLGP